MDFHRQLRITLKRIHGLDQDIDHILEELRETDEQLMDLMQSLTAGQWVSRDAVKKSYSSEVSLSVHCPIKREKKEMTIC